MSFWDRVSYTGPCSSETGALDESERSLVSVLVAIVAGGEGNRGPLSFRRGIVTAVYVEQWAAGWGGKCVTVEESQAKVSKPNLP